MPRGDGTGPGGSGAMTGRGAGYCAGYEMPGYANNFAGRGFGRGRGGGRFGWRNMFNRSGMLQRLRFGRDATSETQIAPNVEKEMLREQAEELQEELDAIKRRLSKIENQTPVEK